GGGRGGGRGGRRDPARAPPTNLRSKRPAPAGAKGAPRSVGIAPIWRRLGARAGRGPRAPSALLPARSASLSRWRAPASNGVPGFFVKIHTVRPKPLLGDDATD